VNKENTNFGIDILGEVPWGTHLCSFFNTKQDLLEILIPFFRAGLENNEFCLWITSTPITVNEAVQALKLQVPNLDNYIGKQSIEIISHTDWYIKEGILDRCVQVNENRL
jgi:hypothetical protein